MDKVSYEFEYIEEENFFQESERSARNRIGEKFSINEGWRSMVLLESDSEKVGEIDGVSCYVYKTVTFSMGGRAYVASGDVLKRCPELDEAYR